MHVRATTRDDLAAVDALLARSYPKLLKPDYPPSVLVTALPLISRAQPALLTSGTYYLIETDGGRLLGAGGWSRDRQVRERGHIRHVVTDFTATRRGVGRLLLGHVLAEARAGDFGRAVEIANRALDACRERNDETLAAVLQQRLELFQSRRPLLE